MRSYPEGLSSEAKAHLETLFAGHDNVMVQAMMTVVLWADMDDGSNHWGMIQRCDVPVSSIVGTMELAKLQLIAMCETGLPFTYGPGGDPDQVPDGD